MSETTKRSNHVGRGEHVVSLLLREPDFKLLEAADYKIWLQEVVLEHARERAEKRMVVLPDYLYRFWARGSFFSGSPQWRLQRMPTAVMKGKERVRFAAPDRMDITQISDLNRLQWKPGKPGANGWYLLHRYRNCWKCGAAQMASRKETLYPFDEFVERLRKDIDKEVEKRRKAAEQQARAREGIKWPKQQFAAQELAFETLQVGIDASPEDIRQAFRRLSIEHHPDRGGDRQRFDEVAKAYERLSQQLQGATI